MPNSGDVVELDLGVSEGREAGFRHPAVVVTAQRILDAGPWVIHVVPVTSTLRSFESEVIIEPEATNGLAVRSSAQCQHIRAVANQRVARTLGNVGSAALLQLRQTIAVLLDLTN